MIAIGPASHFEVSPLIQLLEARFVVRVGETWDVLLKLIRGATCAVLILPALPADFRVLLDRLRAVRGFIPVVVVTDPDPENLRGLGPVIVEEVVLSTTVWSALLPAVATAVASDHLERVASHVVAIRGLDPVIAAPLIAACRADRPTLTVKALGRVARVNRATFHRHWSLALPEGPLPSIVLALMLAVRAAETAVEQGRGWVEVPSRLDVSRSTLARRLTEAVGVGEPLEADPDELLVVAVQQLERVVTMLRARATTQ